MSTAAAPVREFVSQAEFARRQDWSKSYVTKLKGEGRLVLNADGLVDVEQSLQLIRSTTTAPERASPPAQTPAYADASDRDKFYASELKRLEYEAAIGKSVERADAEAVMSDVGTKLRAALEAWPAELAPVLAAAGGDEARITALLVDEVELRLREISRAFAKAGAAAQKGGANG